MSTGWSARDEPPPPVARRTLGRNGTRDPRDQTTAVVAAAPRRDGTTPPTKSNSAMVVRLDSNPRTTCSFRGRSSRCGRERRRRGGSASGPSRAAPTGPTLHRSRPDCSSPPTGRRAGSSQTNSNHSRPGNDRCTSSGTSSSSTTSTRDRATGPSVRHRARHLRDVPQRSPRRRPRADSRASRATRRPSTSRPTTSPTSLVAGTNRWEVVLSDGWYRGRHGTTSAPTTTATPSRSSASSRSVRRTVGDRTRLDVDHRTDPRRRPHGRADRGSSRRATARGNPVRRRPRPRSADLVAAPHRSAASRRSAGVRHAARPPTARSSTSARTSRVDAAERPRPSRHRPHARARRGTRPAGDVTTDHLGVGGRRRSARSTASSPPDRRRGVRATPHRPRVPVRPGRGHPHRLTPDDATGVVVHTDLRRTGWFRCSDDRLNRFHEIADWSFRDNACDIPTDCPHRERSGWTGDWQIFLPSAAFLYDVAGFSVKWLGTWPPSSCPMGSCRTTSRTRGGGRPSRMATSPGTGCSDRPAGATPACSCPGSCTASTAIERSSTSCGRR